MQDNSTTRAGRAAVPGPMALWVLLCAFLCAVGWGLSAVGLMNRTGYAIVLGIGGLAVLFSWKKTSAVFEFPSCYRLRRRFRRSFPRGYLLLSVMALLGGILHPPTNYDGMAYRSARVLHWLAEGHYHWIHTAFNRLNTRSPEFEMLTAPLFAITNSDRLLFLVNIISLLLLPGLAFGLFTRLGVRRRAAWHWMWVVPTGYCFLLQAGSIGNDLFGAVFAAAAIDFALRARQSPTPALVWLSVIAAALMTNSKSSNLVLLLPCAIALLPSLPVLRKRLVSTALVGLFALLVSVLPQLIVNKKYGGDILGARAESGIRLEDQPALLLVGNNSVLFVLQNLVPPVFPMAKTWERYVERQMPPAYRARLEQHFEPFGAHWSLPEMQVEESAGLGFGVALLALVSFLAGLFKRSSGLDPTPPRERWFSYAIVGGAFAGWCVLMTKSGMTTAARVSAPFYLLFLPALLRSPVQNALVRAGWWRKLALLAFLMAAGLLVISPARPLWPAQRVLASVNASSHPLLQRAQTVYSVYSTRYRAFDPAIALLPPGLKTLGFVSFDDPETALWRPFGSRRILHVKGTDSTVDLKRRGIEYVLVNTQQAQIVLGSPVEDWVQRVGGRVVAEKDLRLRASYGAAKCLLVQLPK